MEHLEILTAGVIVRLRSNRIVAVLDDTVLRSLPLAQVSRLTLHHSVEITPSALRAAIDSGVSIVFLDNCGRLRAEARSFDSPGWKDRHLQHLARFDEAKRLEFARAIVAGKIRNQLVLVARIGRTRTDCNVSSELAIMRSLVRKVELAKSRDSLRGFEGAASRAYFQIVRTSLSDEWVFHRRGRHERGATNAALNYCSALLRESVRTAIGKIGLDPETGMMHEPFRERPALALDLMEEWRPPLMESLVLGLQRRREVHESDVSEGLLSIDARRSIIERFERRMSDPCGMGRTYREQIDMNAVSYLEWIRGGAMYEPFSWR